MELNVPATVPIPVPPKETSMRIAFIAVYLHDALPLLRLSRSVQIVTMIRPSVEDNEVDAKGLLAHLFNHGIKVGTDVLQIRTAEEHESLRKQIEQGAL
jgi:hypothetical protein